jgi:hypothetical protein
MLVVSHCVSELMMEEHRICRVETSGKRTSTYIMTAEISMMLAF